MSQATASPASDSPLHWAEGREMNALEALMWRIEVDPRLRSTICGIELLDCVPEWERFAASIDWGSRMAPRFRQKVVEPALGIGNPRWVNDPDFDLHYHLRRIRLPEGGGYPALLRAAEQVAMTPFDRARSPWEAVLFEGLPEGRAAFMMKMHHATTDGLGSVQLFSQLHSRTREHNPRKPQPPPPPPERATPMQILREQLAHDVRAIPGVLRQAIDSVRSAGNPLETAREALEFAASARRMLAEPETEGSPLLRGRSLSWHFIALDVAFKDLRGAAKLAGASLNDAFLAALLGGFRLYHEKLGQPIAKMPIAIPISVRRENDPEGGNRFAGARFAAPVGIVDPRERMLAIDELVRAARNEPALDAASTLAPVLVRLPAPLLTAVAGSLTQSNDLQASNVPGIREAVYIAGAQIVRSYGFGPLPGCASMITLVTHGDICCIGANVDPAAVSEPELFAECLLRGFSEVLALNPDSKPPVPLA